MKTLVTRASTYAAAALAAAWPGSTAAREAQRLARDGYDIGAVHDVDFSLAFDEPAATTAALGAIRDAGFTVTDRSSAARGIVTARTRMRLRPIDLARAASSLNRAIAPFGGFAALVGPATPTRQEISAGSRGSGLPSDVAPAA